jgi:hypothetical protein
MGRPYVLAPGETRRPVRARYTLGERAVFADVARVLIDNDSVHAMLMHVYGKRMPVDAAMNLMVEGVAHARTEMSRIEVTAFVNEMVPRLLSASTHAAVKANGKTARDISRAARRELVKSLKPYRR